MKIVGLTGGIASGKSTVSQILQDKGLVVLDADIFAREVVAPGTFGLKAIVDHYGSEIINSQGELDRKKLGQKIFNDATQRGVLERITHPLIQLRAREEIRLLRRLNHRLIFYDAALIFEKGLNKNFEKTIVVNCTQENQIKRLMQRDSLTEAKAKEIISAQWPLDKKAAAADFVIENNGTKAEILKQIEEILKILLN